MTDALEWTVEVAGARLAVRAWGPPAARGAVCLVHGLGEHTRRYGHVARALVADGFAVVAPDLRGHGRSTGPRGHALGIGELLVDLALVMADAQARWGPTRWALYGHSMGGAIALQYALRRPADVHAVVATGPAIRPAFAPPAWKVAFGRAVRRVSPGLTLHNEVQVAGLAHDPVIVEKYRTDPLVHDRISAALGISLLELGDELLGAAAGLAVPALLVHGAADPITSAPASRAFAARAPTRCRYVEVPGAFHEVHHEVSWPATWDEIRGWLAEALPGEARPRAGATTAG